MKKILVVVHCLEMLALAVWVGGLMTIMAAVIPAVFNSVSMEVGGRVLTRTFQVYDRLTLISAGVLMAGLLTRARLSTAAGARIRTEPLLFTTMLGIAAFLLSYSNRKSYVSRKLRLHLKGRPPSAPPMRGSFACIKSRARCTC